MAGTVKSLNENELKELLDKLFDEMVKKGMLPPDAKKDELVSAVKDKILSNNLTDVNTKDNMAFIKALSGALVGEHLNQKYNLKVDFVKLFRDVPFMNPTEKAQLKNELKDLIKLTLTRLEKKSPNKEAWMDKKDEIADKIANDIMKQAEQTDIMKDDKAMSLLLTLTVSAQQEKAEMSLRSLFGGVLPGQTGGQSIVQGMQSGNEEGFVKQDQSLPTDKSMMADLGQYNPGKPDYVGLENAAKQAAVETSQTFGPLVKEFETSNMLIKDPFATPTFTADK